MSEINNVSDDVKDTVKEIITKHKLDPNSQIVYGVGAENGAGFMSKTVAVDIISDEKTLHLFVKYDLEVKSAIVPLDKLHATERHFFSVIGPDYLKFAKGKGVEDALGNVPTCFGSSEKNVIALENLKKKGYEMVDTQNPMNADHISAVLKSLARFHAISFAFKDQNRERYEAITDHLTYFNDKPEGLLEYNSFPLFDKFLKELDPAEDKLILNNSEEVRVNLLAYFKKMNSIKSKNFILTKGDCWSNNLMFRYENGNKESPVDVVLVDWQMANVESVAKDLSMFFFTSASKEDLKKYNYYLKVYHKELSAYMKKLGSDPEDIFPFSVLEEEWRRHSKFGYGMAILFLRGLTAPKTENAVDVEKIHANPENANSSQEAKLRPEYIERLKDLSEFFIGNDLF